MNLGISLITFGAGSDPSGPNDKPCDSDPRVVISIFVLVILVLGALRLCESSRRPASTQSANTSAVKTASH